jgi:tRNA threonylcarbamoyladenosine modification (KEOPS) complex  Pcc1 subunit
MDNIKMDLSEIGLDVVAQDSYRWRALVNSVMNLRVP